MNGVLNVDKPAGITSHDVVARIRRLAGQKRVGHAGTLDPDATGVLIVCLGNATRLADLLGDRPKVYRALLSLGRTTDTEDASGKTLAESDASHISEGDIRHLLPRFVGNIQQIPPMVSAVHHEGRRLYDLAREGVVVERDARTIHVDSIALSDFSPGREATATLDVVCGKGTYIRTLCADIGAALGVGGHMAQLRRTAVGDFTASEGASLEQLVADTVSRRLIKPLDALAFLRRRIVTADEASDIGHGRDIAHHDGAASPGETICLADSDSRLIALAIVTDDGTMLHPSKVFWEE